MARDPIHSGQNIGEITRAAASYAATVTHANEYTQSLFDKYYARKRADLQDALELEKHELNKERLNEAIESEKVGRQNAQLQGQLTQKQLNSYDEDKALNRQATLSQINAQKANAALHFANAANTNEHTQELKDLKAQGFNRLNPFNETQTKEPGAFENLLNFSKNHNQSFFNRN